VKLIFSLILSLTMASAFAVFDQFNHDNTISGPDLNNNGIRDDIEVYIAAQAYTPAQRQSMQQAAKAIANILRVNTIDQNELRASDLSLQKSINCAWSRFPVSGAVTASTELKMIQKITVNTKARVEVYAKYQIAMNGKVLASPQGDSCESRN